MALFRIELENDMLIGKCPVDKLVGRSKYLQKILEFRPNPNIKAFYLKLPNMNMGRPNTMMMT